MLKPKSIGTNMNWADQYLYNDKIDNSINNMFSLGDYLSTFNYPVGPKEIEDDLSYIKRDFMVIDGYEIGIYYNKSKFENYYLKSAQIYSDNCFFLPINMVVKIGKKLLGDSHLVLMELIDKEKKVYCWSVYENFDNIAIESPYLDEYEEREYGNFKYNYVEASDFDFY